MPFKTNFSDKTLTITITGEFNHSNVHGFIDAFTGTEGEGVPNTYIVKIDDKISNIDESAFTALNKLHKEAGKAKICIICTKKIANSLNTQGIDWAEIKTTDKPRADFFKPLKSQP